VASAIGSVCLRGLDLFYTRNGVRVVR
jgi:hypothetical protein